MPKTAYGWSAPSKLLQKKWDQRQHRLHQQKVLSMKSGIDNSKPKDHPHMVLRLKKYQLQEERQAEIDHQNNLLLTRMTEILQKPGRVDNWNEYRTRSLNQSYREREQERIARENIKIAQFLHHVKPKYVTKEWEEDYGTKHEYLMKMWANSTKDFPSSPRHVKKSEIHIKSSGEHDYESDFEDDDSESNISDSKPRQKLDDDKLENSRFKQDVNSVTKFVKVRHKDTLAESDAKLLFKAIKRLLPLEAIVVQTLIRRSQNQRMATLKKFDDFYDLNLLAELKSELDSECHVLLEVLLSERAGPDTQAISVAIHENDTVLLTQVFCSKEPSALRQLNKAYHKRYDVTMEEDIQARVLDEGCQSLLTTLLQEGRVDGESINENKVDVDALALHESGEGRFTDDRGVFMRLLRTRSGQHVNAVFDSFKRISGGHTIMEAMKQDGCSKEYVNVIQNLEKCFGLDAAFWSDKIHSQLKPNHPELIRILLDRSDEETVRIKKAYRKKYKLELTEAIMNKCGKKAGLLVAQIVMRYPSRNTKLTKPSKTKSGQFQSKRVSARPKLEAKNTEAIRDSPFVRRGETHGGAAQGSASDVSTFHKKKISEQSPRHLRKARDGKSPRHAANQGNTKREKIKLDENYIRNIHEAIKGWKTNEEPLTKILTENNNQQRQNLRVQYKDKYGKNLKDALMTELGVEFQELIFGFLQTPHEYDAFCLHSAIRSKDNFVDTIITIIATRSAKDLGVIKTVYHDAFGRDLKQDLQIYTVGDLIDILVALVDGSREGGKIVHSEMAKSDAESLKKESESGFQEDNITFKALLTKSNKPQLKLTFTKYEEMTGKTIQSSIKDANLGADEENYLSLLHALLDPVDFYATSLYSAMDGLNNTNDSKVIRICVSRSEIDLPEIKSHYKNQFGEKLEDDIRKQCNSIYRDLLLALVKKV